MKQADNPVAPDSVSAPLDVRAAKQELKQARMEMKEARADLKQAKAEARKKRQVLTWRNELRVGWGDQLFESLMWHNPTYTVTTMPTTWTKTYKERYRYSQHIWLEYQYRFSHWFSLGAMTDVSYVGWDLVTRDGTGAELARDKKNHFYNVVVMPTVRFTYISHEYVHLYSGLGLGLGINGGTETNAAGKTTELCPAFNVTLIGVSANYKRWFCAFDFGGMYSLKGAQKIFLAKSRMLNLSIGVRL